MNTHTIALIKDGEPRPQDCRGYPLRIGNLSAELASRGHEVHWYSSTFFHQKKEFIFESETTLRELNYYQHFLPVGGYRRNISPQRFMHHARFGLALHKKLSELPKLDLIVCCIPILEAAYACLRVAEQRGVSLVLDIRDPWPDIFVTVAPPKLRPLASALLYPYALFARYLYRSAQSLTAVSHGFLEWAQRSSGRTARSVDRVFFHGAHQPVASGEPLPDEWLTEPGVIRHAFIGAFGRNYVFDTMAEAILKLGPDASHHFFFVGDGSLHQDRLRQELEAQPHVTFTGWQPREKAYALGRSCHLGWLPLRAGNDDFLPNKPFEYAALELGIVAARSAEYERLVDEHDVGITYEQGNSASLFAKLGQLSIDEAQIMGRNAHALWTDRGQAPKIASEFADHLECLLGSYSTLE